MVAPFKWLGRLIRSRKTSAPPRADAKRTPQRKQFDSRPRPMFESLDGRIHLSASRISAHPARAHQAPVLASPIYTSVGANPQAIFAADFNDDGRSDIAVSNTDSGLIHIFLSKGSGSFARPITVNPGVTGITDITGADLNGDGDIDLVVVGNRVVELPGKGDGTFGAPITLAKQGHTRTATVGDVNGDGYPDIVLPDYYYGTVTILYNNKRGGFKNAALFGAGVGANDVVIGDFAHTGRVELAVACGGSGVSSTTSGVAILTQDKRHVFKQTAFETVPGNPIYVTAGDLNLDGYTDLVTANGGLSTNPGQDSVSVLLGEAAGAFAAAQTYPTPKLPEWVQIADLNHDFYPDLVVADYGANEVSLLLGNGQGSFTSEDLTKVNSGPAQLITGDFNGDGLLDVAVAAYGSGDLAILLQNSTT